MYPTVIGNTKDKLNLKNSFFDVIIRFWMSPLLVVPAFAGFEEVAAASLPVGYIAQGHPGPFWVDVAPLAVVYRQNVLGENGVSVRVQLELARDWDDTIFEALSHVIINHIPSR